MDNILRDIPKDCLDFKAFCEYLHKASGIVITPSKSYLVSARIRHIMEDYSLSNLSELVKELHRNNTTLQQKIVDSMTTNETFWFRDDYPFQYFYETLLPHWSSTDYKESAIKIWSAACSSGQEPFSLAILLEEYKAKNTFNKRVEITATDLSSHILDKAKQGIFDRLSIARGLSENRIGRFFEHTTKNEWCINDDVKRHIQFKSLNLLDNYTGMGKFDIIFCRNVLIYFDKDTKSDILTRMHQCLKPNGLLFLGSSESLAGASHLFSMEHCNPGIVYRAN